MIKILKTEQIYFEQEQSIELEINGKKIVAIRYEKQDPKFSDYELEVEIQDKELLNLTDDETEEIEEFVKNDIDDGEIK